MHFGLLLRYCYTVHISARLTSHMIPVATRSKAWVCGRSLVAIAGSNPGGGMDVLSFLLCVVSAPGRSLAQRSHTSCGVSECDLETSAIRRAAESLKSRL